MASAKTKARASEPAQTGVTSSALRETVGVAGHLNSTVQSLKEKLGLQHIIGESPVLLREIEKLPQFARCNATVLISGETGTGKEACARAIHYLSSRSGQPFVAANCGAIPVELMENELFGHEPGAFTGAQATLPGLVAEAGGGTLFLDEVDALSAAAQVKLLRLLQEKEYRPLGARRIYRADVRVIAASNAHFDQTIEAGRFRRDLFYRLNVLEVHLPALRDRREDIPLLARHFVEKYDAEFQLAAHNLAPDALRRLASHDWPGNIRELQNVIERAVLLAADTTLTSADFVLTDAVGPPIQSFRALKAQAVARFERDYLKTALLTHNGNITQAARAAQKNRRAFWQLLRKHQLTVTPHSSPRG